MRVVLLSAWRRLFWGDPQPVRSEARPPVHPPYPHNPTDAVAGSEGLRCSVDAATVFETKAQLAIDDHAGTCTSGPSVSPDRTYQRLRYDLLIRVTKEVNPVKPTTVRASALFEDRFSSSPRSTELLRDGPFLAARRSLWFWYSVAAEEIQAGYSLQSRPTVLEGCVRHAARAEDGQGT